MDAGISAGASFIETGEERGTRVSNPHGEERGTRVSNPHGEERGTRVSNHEAIDTWPGPA
jgi:hypothetical protein